MKFFNPKEETLKIELTPYGKEQFSKGKFKPAFYTFSDEDITYNTKLAPGAPDELQSAANPRIIDETPRTQPQTHFYELPVIPFSGQDTGLDTETDPGLLDQNIIFESARKIQSSLGNMILSGNTGPAFKITFLEGEVKSTSNFYTSASAAGVAGTNTQSGHYDVPIPQIDVDLEFKTAISTFRDPPFQFDPSLSRQLRFTDGGTEYIQSNQITIVVEETNTNDLFENFEVEVYEMSDDINTSLGNNQLQHLPILKQIPDIQMNNNLLAERSDFNRQRNRLNSIVATPNESDYYFDIFTDAYEEINEDYICSLVAQLKSQGFELDIGFDCPDAVSVDDSRYNIYDSDAEVAEKCP